MSEKEYAKLISKNLKRLSYENGKTQADIAKDLKISKQTVSSWFRGERTPRMDKIDLLCHYFNCKRSDIMEDYSERSETEGGTTPYYLNEETARVAQKYFDHPEIRVLFDAADGVKADNIMLAAEMLKRFKETNSDG